MKITIHVTSCILCPFREEDVYKKLTRYCSIMEKFIPWHNSFPEWCPLLNNEVQVLMDIDVLKNLK